MWPSQRVQNLIVRRTESHATTTDLSPNSDQTLFNNRPGGGVTSKIEIRHTTRLNSPSLNPPISSAPSITYISGKENRKVAFTMSALRASTSIGGGNMAPSDSSVFSSKSSVLSNVNQLSGTNTNTGGGNVHGNELAGQVVIQAICNRDSVIEGLGGNCNCLATAAAIRVNEEELEKIQELTPEKQQEQLCKLMIRLVQEREAKNEKLVALQAQQKLVTASKLFKHHKIRHILCIQGRTIDGTDIAMGNFPNSFSEIKQLMDLRRDPPGFQRFTAKVDMRGFSDEEISLTNEGNILRITGARRKQEDKSAKIITEEIILPKGVYADCLRIGRAPKGFVIIQEPWKF